MRNSYPATAESMIEVITHQPVPVEALTVAKSKKYTKLIRDTLVPTKIDKKAPRVR